MHSWEDFAFGRNLGAGEIPVLPKARVLRDAEKSKRAHAYKILDPRSPAHRCLSMRHVRNSRGRDRSTGRHAFAGTVALPAGPASGAPPRRLVRHTHLARGPRHHSDLDVRYRLAR